MAVGKRSRICQRPKRTIFVFGDLFQGEVAGSESVYCSLGLVFSVFFARILSPQKTMCSWQLASRLFGDASGTRKVPWCWRCKVKPSILGSSSALTRTDFVMAFYGCVFGQVQTEGSGGSSGWVWPGKRFGPDAFAWLPKQQLKKRWLRVSWSVLVSSWQTCGGMKRRQRQQWKWRVRTIDICKSYHMHSCHVTSLVWTCIFEVCGCVRGEGWQDASARAGAVLLERLSWDSVGQPYQWPFDACCSWGFYFSRSFKSRYLRQVGWLILYLPRLDDWNFLWS